MQEHDWKFYVPWPLPWPLRIAVVLGVGGGIMWLLGTILLALQ